MSVEHHWQFLRRYLRNPNVVGALAPSSRSLAGALCEPLRRFARPAKILEVGAGTGAVTQYLLSILRRDDELDICEVDPLFATILRRDVLSEAEVAAAVAAGRVRLLELPVQELKDRQRYDFVISGLPFTVFALADVQEAFQVIRESLKPGGVFSYFEYVGMRRTSRLLSIGERRMRIRSVSRYLSRNIREHQFREQVVLHNFPPAHARHLRFDIPQSKATEGVLSGSLGA